MAITHAVYDPPVSSLPYLVAVFHPGGAVKVAAFKTAQAADAYATPGGALPTSKPSTSAAPKSAISRLKALKSGCQREVEGAGCGPGLKLRKACPELGARRLEA